MTRAEIQEFQTQGMKQLAGDPRFQAYMNLLLEAREAVITDLCSDEVVASDRMTLAAIGELRTYQRQIDTYNQIKDTLPEQG